MNDVNYLNSCIEYLKKMLGDQTNELESEDVRTLTEGLRKLKKLKKQTDLTIDEKYRVVSEIAEAVSKILL